MADALLDDDVNLHASLVTFETIDAHLELRGRHGAELAPMHLVGRMCLVRMISVTPGGARS